MEHDGINFISSMDHVADVRLNNEQIEMLRIITKHAILSSFAIAFNMLFYISVIIGSSINVSQHQRDVYFIGYAHLIKAAYGFVMAFTTYLGFKFNNELYFRLCKKYHSFCYRRFRKVTKKRISTKLSVDSVATV